MKINIENSKMERKSIERVEFNGFIDFDIDENGNVVNGDKVITHQELFEMVKPIEEKEETIETEEPLTAQDEWAN